MSRPPTTRPAVPAVPAATVGASTVDGEGLDRLGELATGAGLGVASGEGVVGERFGSRPSRSSSGSTPPQDLVAEARRRYVALLRRQVGKDLVETHETVRSCGAL